MFQEVESSTTLELDYAHLWKDDSIQSGFNPKMLS